MAGEAVDCVARYLDSRCLGPDQRKECYTNFLAQNILILIKSNRNKKEKTIKGITEDDIACK